MSRKLKPLDEPYSQEVADILSTYPHRDGYLLSLFRVFANSVRFLKKGVANLLDKESPLPLRQREIIILRVCANLGCEYEWGVHVTAFSKAARLSRDQVRESLMGSSTSSCWADDEALLIAVVDGLCRAGSLDLKIQEGLEATWSLEEQLEILALVGNYHTICFVANVARLEGEKFGAKFPESDGDSRLIPSSKR